eukprot:jgi/Mesvir1/24335/Mv11016-RA.1
MGRCDQLVRTASPIAAISYLADPAKCSSCTSRTWRSATRRTTSPPNGASAPGSNEATRRSTPCPPPPPCPASCMARSTSSAAGGWTGRSRRNPPRLPRRDPLVHRPSRMPSCGCKQTTRPCWHPARPRARLPRPSRPSTVPPITLGLPPATKPALRAPGSGPPLSPAAKGAQRLRAERMIPIGMISIRITPMPAQAQFLRPFRWLPPPGCFLAGDGLHPRQASTAGTPPAASGTGKKARPPLATGFSPAWPVWPSLPPRPPLFSAFTAAASDASATGAPPPAAAAISKRAPYKAPGDRNDLRILRHLVEAQKLEDSLAAPDMPLTGIRCGPAPGDTWARHTLAGLGAAVSLRWDDAMEDVANIPAYATGAAHVAGVAHGISAGHASRAAHPFGVASAFSVAHEGHLEDAMDGSHHGIDNHASDSNHESDRDTCRRDGHGAAVQDVAGAVLYKKLFLHRRPCMRRPADGCALQTRHKTFLAWPEPGGPGCSPSVPAALLDDEARHRKAVGSRVVDVSRREFMERRPKEVDVARARWQRDSCAAALAYSQRIAAAEAAHHQVEVRYPHGLPRAVQKSLGEQLGEAGVHL